MVDTFMERNKDFKPEVGLNTSGVVKKLLAEPKASD
jgi:hypothetical protein